MGSRLLVAALLFACACALFSGCALQAPWPSQMDSESEDLDAAQASFPPLRLVTWNLQWFQDPSEPPEDGLQRAGAVSVLWQLGADIVALQEIASVSGFEALRDALGDYASVLSESSAPQRLALLYRRERFELQEMSDLTGLADAGRPPLAVELLDRARDELLCLVVVHAKANAELASYATRLRFATGLREKLQDLRAARGDALAGMIVLGDFNDGLTRSVTTGRASPFTSLLQDWSAPTARLEAGPEPSTVWGSTIDHILLDRALEPRVLPESVDVARDELGDWLETAPEAVSDHYAVRLELR